MLSWILAAAPSLALGYAAGRLRPGRWLFDKAYDAATGERRGIAWALAVPLALLALAVHPRRSIRHMRSWRGPEAREPAPEMDPDWGRR